MSRYTVVAAKKLRRRMTDAEQHLWWKLRANQLNGAKFRRQHPLGAYIADFVCFEARLIVEVDGGQHAESRTDRVRDEWFRSQGYRVLRFWNNEVLSQTRAVLERIAEYLTPSP